MTEKNTKLAREWLQNHGLIGRDSETPQGVARHESLAALLDQKDAEWSRDVREVRAWADDAPFQMTTQDGCDEILKRRGQR